MTTMILESISDRNTTNKIVPGKLYEEFLELKLRFWPHFKWPLVKPNPRT